jgi:hypothetical protein
MQAHRRRRTEKKRVSPRPHLAALFYAVEQWEIMFGVWTCDIRRRSDTIVIIDCSQRPVHYKDMGPNTRAAPVKAPRG